MDDHPEVESFLARMSRRIQEPLSASVSSTRQNPRTPKVRRQTTPGRLVIGQLLYHGTSNRESFTDLASPAWVTNVEGTAEWFAKWRGDSPKGPRRVLVYMLTSKPKLQLFKDAQAIQRFMEERTGESESDVGLLVEEVCSAGYDGWNVPGNYEDTRADDILLCEPGQWLMYVETHWIDPEPEEWRVIATRGNPERVTEQNLDTMIRELHRGGGTIPGRIKPAAAPGIKKCINAGLLRMAGATWADGWVLSADGERVVSDYLAAHPMRDPWRTRSNPPQSQWWEGLAIYDHTSREGRRALFAEIRSHPDRDQYEWYWHITSSPGFKIDPAHRPIIARGLCGKSRSPGLFLTLSPWQWAFWYGKGPLWAVAVRPSVRFVYKTMTAEGFDPDPANAQVLWSLPLQDAIERFPDDFLDVWKWVFSETEHWDDERGKEYFARHARRGLKLPKGTRLRDVLRHELGGEPAAPGFLADQDDAETLAGMLPAEDHAGVVALLPRPRSNPGPLKKGQLLYHGTCVNEPFADLQRESWVTDVEETARQFSDEGYMPGDPYSGGHRRILVYRLRAMPSLIRFRSERSIQRFVKATTDDTFWNVEKLVDLVCVRGDGWIIVDNYEDTKGHDIMLCEPEKWLEYVETHWIDPKPRGWK